MQVDRLADEWKIIESGFDAPRQRAAESIFSLGNGKMGLRGNFEENYSGDSLQGFYIAGVYYPDKTKVGWWKTGYPDYYAKMINAPSWNGIGVTVDGHTLDLYRYAPESFTRVLDMKAGNLKRTFRISLPGNRLLEVESLKFLSMADDESGAIRYSIKPVNFSGLIEIRIGIEADVTNEDSNYGEKFWRETDRQSTGNLCVITTETQKSKFRVCTAIKYETTYNGNSITVNPVIDQGELFLYHCFSIDCSEGSDLVIYKYAAVTSSVFHHPDKLQALAVSKLGIAAVEGFERMMSRHKEAWEDIWKTADIIISGDPLAQQAVRYNVFNLYQTYTGRYSNLNVGPKGFTGEKYGGSTYWDTEAYCLPFYMCTAGSNVARNLLLYRYRHLEKAIENAATLGFTKGAALYPMVTVNGQECHNEWEITFEEIHRNAAIAYAIFNYVRYTGDKEYYSEGGLEVLTGIARFWEQRVNWSAAKNKYVILGVTGPNEYENNVSNNWYTNIMAAWCLEYCIEVIELMKEEVPEELQFLAHKVNLDIKQETGRWKHIIENMYYPVDAEKGIFLQQDGYLDKEQVTVGSLGPGDIPLNRKWSWDRILRSCFIKQADVLQGLYFLEDRFEKAVIKRNFEFYEPRTVHESSLSPGIHSLIASRTGYQDKAYQLFLRSARLDLDDYNKEVDEGLHITSMGGTWMAVVEGFGGFRVRDGIPGFDPALPTAWKSLSFGILFRKNRLKITVSAGSVSIINQEGPAITVSVYGKRILIGSGDQHISN